MPDVFAAFDTHVRARERAYRDELSTLNGEQGDHLEHIRAFGRSMHAFAGRPM